MKLSKLMNKRYIVLIILVVTLSPPSNASSSKTLLLLDNSVSNDTYIPSNKESQIEAAFEIAIDELKNKYPKCKINFKKQIERADQLNIFKQSEKIKKEFTADKTIIFGLIHSSEALLAAKAFTGTAFQVLSSGATTENINEINTNFYTLANPVSSFAKVMMDFIKSKKFRSVLSLIPGDSSYAKEFSISLKNKLIGSGISLNEIEYNPTDVENNLKEHQAQILNSDLIFAPGFIQQSLAAVSVISNFDKIKPILGTPNWGRSVPDLINFYSKLDIKKNKIYFPVSWIAGETQASKKLEYIFKNKYQTSPMGTAIYTYDAAVVAGSYLCTHQIVAPNEFKEYLAKAVFQNLTARNYDRLIAGHMKSNISMIEFANGKKLIAAQKNIQKSDQKTVTAKGLK